MVSGLLMAKSECIDQDEWDAENLSLGKGLKRFSQPGFFDSTLFRIMRLKAELIPTRATLIEKLKNWQDQASWQEFFDIYWRLIYCVARKAGLSEVEAQDVVQETLVSVAKHIP